MEKHKLRHLFAELTKEVLLKRPDDPISYLINYIGKRNKRQIVCIQGYDEETRSKISTSVSIKFNYGHINLSALFKEDYHLLGNEDVSRKVLEEFKKIDPIFKGVIISGYPNNASQADHLHKSGILPDRYFVMQTSPEYLKKL